MKGALFGGFGEVSRWSAWRKCKYRKVSHMPWAN
jgi:hypothetical protein